MLFFGSQRIRTCHFYWELASKLRRGSCLSWGKKYCLVCGTLLEVCGACWAYPWESYITKRQCLVLLLRASLHPFQVMLSAEEQFILLTRIVILGANWDDGVILLARILFYIENIKYSASNNIIYIWLSLLNLIMNYYRALS